MSMWQFFAMVDGLSKTKNSLSSEEEDEIWEWMQAKDGNNHS